MSTNVVPGPPVQDLLEGGTWSLRHVYPVLPWFSAAVLSTPGVIRYYRLDETTGTSAADATGSGLAGTYQGTPTLGAAGLWTPDDATNRAVTFNGTTQYVDLPTIDFATACKSFTIEAIVNASSLAAIVTVFEALGAVSDGNLIVVDVLTTGVLRLLFGTTAGTFQLITSTGVVTAGTTYHVACTYNAATDAAAIYLNGVTVASGSQGPYTGTATPTCKIGQFNGTNFWNGTIDEAAIYARALSAAEVLAHAEAAGLAPSSTVNGGLVKRSSTLILGKPYGATIVPVSTNPASPDFASGTYTHRLDDAGEFDLTFPNGVASDGVLWRERFTPDGHRDWVEVYRGPIADASRLEFVGTTESISVTRDSVTVKGGDAFTLLKKAYESDREWTAAPRDVAEAYSKVHVIRSMEEFSSSPSTWTPFAGSALAIDTAQSVGTVTGTPAYIYTDFPSPLGESWDVIVTGNFTNGPIIVVSGTGVSPTSGGALTTNGHAYLSYNYGTQTGTIEAGSGGGTPITLAFNNKIANIGITATAQISRRGRWIYFYLNGGCVGILAWFPPTIATGRVHVGDVANGTATLDRIVVRSADPFLTRGTTVGDKHLPGTYPAGGLHGRYFNDADLQGRVLLERNIIPFTPGRPVSADRLDTNPGTGVSSLPANLPTDYMSIRWYGAVYLRGDLGDYQFQTTGTIGAVRLWVANTDFGDQILDDWSPFTSRTVGPATVDSTIFGDRAAWVPIIVEFRDDAQAQAFNVQFQPPGAGTYTDPGGGTITRGSFATIPQTSLSPLGCFDQRVQGASHYDLVKQATEAFGLHLWLEPMQLESGEFPGRLTAKERWGRDTSVQLRSEDLDVADPFLSPSVETDASDMVTTLRGSGAGIADGRGSQVTAEITDSAASTFALFDMQGTSDAGDIAFRDLLAARLDAELGLRNTPWTNITGQPRGRERLADTWPLSDTYSAMRWRPGDAVRLSVPEIGVDDASPRQILQVTREIVPEGLSSCQVAFRQRPRGAASALRRATRQALIPRRVYQRQKEVIASAFFSEAILNGASGAFNIITLLPGDQVVAAWLVIPLIDVATTVGVEINFTDRTTALGGAWGTVPTRVDITPFAKPDTTSPRMFIRAINKGPLNANAIQTQFFVEVLR